MEIVNKPAHKNCFCYEGDMAAPTVGIREMECGHEEEQVFPRNEIAFMTEGEARFSFGGCPEQTQHEGEFIFIPMGGTFRFVAVKRTTVVVVRLNNSITLCNNCRLEDLYRRPCAPAGEENPPAIHTLEINPSLSGFVHSLDNVVRSGLCCRHYFDTKAREMLILLRAYYSDDRLRGFFSLILTPDIRFSEHVRANHHLCHTVSELAESLNMTLKHFEKIFYRVFGMPPGRWMNREKAHMIRHELCLGTKPLKQITDDYGFANQQQLNRFCKREMGFNPGEMRNGRKG